MIYRKYLAFNGLFFTVYDKAGKTMSSEAAAIRYLDDLTGSNEMLKCMQDQGQVHCLLVVEGNYFSEVIFDVQPTPKLSAGGFRGLGKPDVTPAVSLILNSSKCYNHYLNSVTEKIDFSSKYIILQTTLQVPKLSNDTIPPRHMMIFERTNNNTDLYMGIPCSNYSDTCSSPIDIIFALPESCFISSTGNSTLIMKVDISNRKIVLAPGPIPDVSSLQVLITNPVRSLDNKAYNLTQVIKFSETEPTQVVSFDWILAAGMLIILLIPAGIGLKREIQNRKTFNIYYNEEVYKSYTRSSRKNPKLARKGSDESNLGSQAEGTPSPPKNNKQSSQTEPKFSFDPRSTPTPSSNLKSALLPDPIEQVEYTPQQRQTKSKNLLRQSTQRSDGD